MSLDGTIMDNIRHRPPAKQEDVLCSAVGLLAALQARGGPITSISYCARIFFSV